MITLIGWPEAKKIPVLNGRRGFERHCRSNAVYLFCIDFLAAATTASVVMPNRS